MTVRDINTIIETLCPNDEDYEKPIISPKYLRQELEQLALEQEHRHLEQEPTTKKDLGVDCISRADAIRVASGYCHPSNVAKELAKLPSVTPQEPILDKISAEINAMFPPSGAWMYEEGHEVEHTVCEVLVEVLHIIDKYKADRSKEQTGENT